MAKRITEDTLRQHGFAIPEGGVGNISDETRHLLNIYLNRPDVSSQYLDIQLAKKGRAGRIPLKRDVSSRVRQLESQSVAPKKVSQAGSAVPTRRIPVSDSSAFKSASAARAPSLPIDPALKRAAAARKAPPKPKRKPFRKLISDITSTDRKKSLAAARKAGHLYYWRDGKKMAAVTGEDLKTSGLNLRDYMNKQLDKTRRKAPVPKPRKRPPQRRQMP